MKTLLVLLVTTFGNVAVELDPVAAPETTKNFVQYVEDGHYNGTIFHRVIPGFMVQGGGFDGMMNQKPTRAPVKNEAGNGLKNARGTLAMARTGDPHSATAQFFINTVDNRFLDRDQAQDGWGYTVFGKVVYGMDVIDRIETVRTGTRFGAGGPMRDVPLSAVVITEARVIASLDEAKPGAAPAGKPAAPAAKAAGAK